MATLYTIEGSAEQGVLARDAICANYGYQTQVTDETGDLVSNPETNTEFAKRIINDFIKNNVKKYRVDQFEKGVAQTISDAENEISTLTIS